MESEKKKIIKVIRNSAVVFLVIGLFFLNLTLCASAIGFQSGWFFKIIPLLGILSISTGVFLFSKSWKLKNQKTKSTLAKKQKDRELNIIKIGIVVCISLMFLLAFAYIGSRVSVSQEIKSEPDWKIKVNFCEEHGQKYYRNACWIQLFPERLEGGYKFPILVNSTGDICYTGEKEFVSGGAYPHI